MGFPLFLPPSTPLNLIGPTQFSRARANANGGGDSYLGMWKKAVDRERKAADLLKMTQNSALESPELLEKKSQEFEKILQVSKEERDRVQRIQVIDRAAAAIAAARALLKDAKNNKPTIAYSRSHTSPQFGGTNNGGRASENESPGPNFWSWTPPTQVDSSNPRSASIISAGVSPVSDVMEMETPTDFLSIPFERELSQTKDVVTTTLPPFQSFMEVHEVEAPSSTHQSPPPPNEEIRVQFSSHAAIAADALHNVDGKPCYGINVDGSRWWKETGVETRADGVVCRWTLNRGVTADGFVEWEEKYWEAADQFAYKELGSQKSGRDAMGNVWHEYWKESMCQEQGLLHMEKTADKWGKNGKGDEWQEKWFEHYDASGKTEKWAHKWCSIDPITEVEVGHGHVWTERWGEKYDGQGGSVKYTDKWAERYEGDGWVKWGDKWDEHFDQNGHGVKQGETWWQGKYGEQWNRTWGEQHNGTGWVHKYGKSSSGEHWDTHAQEDTWYERYPHFGFMHCLINSVQLRGVPKPSESETS